MAELGVAAAILQIVQLTAQVALKTNSLAGKLKHAPQLINSSLRSVYDFTYLLCALKSALRVESGDRPCIRDVLSDRSRAYIQELLQRCNEEVSLCDSLLLPIMPQDGRMWKEAWKRILSIKREEDITQRLKNLDSLRSQLSIWYSHQLMLLTCRVHVSVTSIDDRLQSLHQDVFRGLTTLDTSATAMNQLANEVCNRIASRPSLLANLTHDGFQPRRPDYLGCRCQQISKHAIALEYKFFRHRKTMIEGHQPGCGQFRRTLAKKFEDRINFSLFSRCIEITLARPQYSGWNILFGLKFIPIVDARTAPSFERFRHAKREVRKALGVGRPVLSSVIFCGDITEGMLSKVKQAMQELLGALVEDFQSEKYSARDQNWCGLTLLHEYTCILIEIWPLQSELHDLIKKTVGLLVEYVADVHVMAMKPIPSVEFFSDMSLRTAHWERPRLHTALSLSLQCLGTQDIVKSGIDASIPRIFSRYGTDAFYGTYSSNSTFHYVCLFPKATDLALEYGCSQLTVAVARRDQYEVERLIRNHHDVNDTISPPFSPLCLAIGWRVGVDILLKAGADPSTAVHCAIFFEDEIFLQILLDKGSFLEAKSEHVSWSLFQKASVYAATPHLQPQGFWVFNKFANSLLSFALWRQRTQKIKCNTVASLIVQASAVSRQKLMDLAKKHIPVLELKRCGWDDPFNNVLVCDAVALTLARFIYAKEVDIPLALWPSTKQSVYHDEWRAATVAEELFLAGFEQVDLVDETGRTPLLVNAHFTRMDILERSACLYWFLHHGAERVEFSNLNGKSLVHILAANLGSAWHIDIPGNDGFENIVCANKLKSVFQRF